MTNKNYVRLKDVTISKTPDRLLCAIDSFDSGGYLRAACPDLVFLGARPGIGKTLFATQIGAQISKMERSVLMFSLEMSKEQIRSRLGRQPTEGFYINETAGLNIDRLCSISREFYAQEPNPSLIIIDYAQIVAALAPNPFEKVNIIVEKLKRLARELSIPILAIAQLNRNSESRENPEPYMSDFADSSAIEKWADVALIMKRMKGSELVGVHCVKNRWGMRKNFMLRINQRSLELEDAGDISLTDDKEVG